MIFSSIKRHRFKLCVRARARSLALGILGYLQQRADTDLGKTYIDVHKKGGM